MRYDAHFNLYCSKSNNQSILNDFRQLLHLIQRLKTFVQVQCLACVSTQTLQLHCHSYQMSYRTHFLVLFRKLITNLFHEFRQFLRLIQYFLKFFVQVQRFASVSTQTLKLNCDSYKGAITHILSRLAQKVIKECFS